MAVARRSRLACPRRTRQSRSLVAWPHVALGGDSTDYQVLDTVALRGCDEEGYVERCVVWATAGVTAALRGMAFISSTQARAVSRLSMGGASGGYRHIVCARRAGVGATFRQLSKLRVGLRSDAAGPAVLHV